MTKKETAELLDGLIRCELDTRIEFLDWLLEESDKADLYNDKED